MGWLQFSPYFTLQQQDIISFYFKEVLVPNTINSFLVAGALLSAIVAALHFACIFWGAAGFRFLGAGEPIAEMAARGHWYPSFIAFVIGGVLLSWSVYALSGAGVVVQLPYLRIVLSAITLIYLLRAVLFPLLKPAFPNNSDTFWLVTSGICLVIGVIHLIGLRQVWERL